MNDDYLFDVATSILSSFLREGLISLEEGMSYYELDKDGRLAGGGVFYSDEPIPDSWVPNISDDKTFHMCLHQVKVATGI